MFKSETGFLYAFAAVTSPIWGTYFAVRYAKEHPLRTMVAAAAISAVAGGRMLYNEHVRDKDLKAARIILSDEHHDAYSDKMVNEICKKHGMTIPENLESPSERKEALTAIESKLKE